MQYTWDGRIRSPREMFRLLHDFLNKYGYEHTYHELKGEPGEIEGTATFWDALIGRKDYKRRNVGFLIIGIILIIISLILGVAGYNNESFEIVGVGAGLLIVGIILIVKSSTKLRKCIHLHLEGESYRASGQQHSYTLSQVYDVVSNCRVTFTGSVGHPDSEGYGVSNIIKNKEEWDSLQSEFNSLTNDFEKLRPRIEIPVARGYS